MVRSPLTISGNLRDKPQFVLNQRFLVVHIGITHKFQNLAGILIVLEFDLHLFIHVAENP